MTRLKSGRGGTRVNAGRPALDPDQKRVTVTVRLRPDVAEWLKAQPGSVGAAIDAMFDATRANNREV